MATWYVATTGNDSTGTGSVGSPWAKPSHACTHVTTGGDIIHVNAGTYTETSQAALAVNVSMEGAGMATTIIKSHYTIDWNDNRDDAYMQLAGGSNTTQHISGITFDGDNYNGDVGIVVYDRSNVEILNCTVIHFHLMGVRFTGSSSGNSGNSLHDCILTDCAGYTNDRESTLFMKNQTGFEFYNSIFTQVTRSGSNANGDGLRYEDGNRECKIYNNTLNGNWPDDNNCFLFEAWESSKSDIGHGLEIYGNTVVGLFDFGSGLVKGAYDYSIRFYSNIVGEDITHTANSGIYRSGVEFEEICDGMIVDHNLFKNCDRAIYFCHNGTNGAFSNIEIYSNIIRDTYNSWTDRTEGGITYGGGFGIFFGGGGSPSCDSVVIRNNTIIAHAAAPAGIGIWIDTESTANDVTIQNNIIVGFSQAPYGTANGGGSWTGLLAQNNLMYGNGHSNSLLEVGLTIGSKTVNGEIKGNNPNFINSSDFHLTTGSPAIGAGIDVGLDTDYGDNAWNATPSIGAYEFGSVPPPNDIPVTTITVTGTGNATTISTNHGTLQMSAHCNPYNATDQTVIWSITSGLSFASISNVGLLTALGNGTVTIRATANDGSGVYGNIQIIITNQVSTGTNFYIKTGGNDTSTGTSDSSAWATISKVNAFWAAGSFAPGDNIYFNKGDTFYGTLTVGESGTSGSPITIGAYGTGANPIITGFTTISSGWTSYGSGRYYKALSCESNPNIVLIDNVNTPMGRYPKSGNYLQADSSTSSSITDSAVSGSNWNGGEVIFQPYPWWIYRCPVTSHSGSTLNFSDSDMSLGNNSNYFIQNHLSTLTAAGTTAGEWYYNGTNFYIYNGGSAPSSTVKVPTLDCLVIISGKNYITFDNISFQGANNSILYMNNSSHIIVQNCDLKYSGNFVIDATEAGTSNYNTFTYCTVDEIQNNIIRLHATNWNYTSFTHNIIRNIGTIEGAAPIGQDDYYYSGIYTRGPNTLIEYNSFYNVGYNPIIFEREASASIIRYNFIDTFCFLKSDGGGIYCWVPNNGPHGPDVAVQIISNIVINGIGASNFGTPLTASQAYGIYMDNRTSNIIITGNTVYNMNGYGLFFNDPSFMAITNNTALQINYISGYAQYINPWRIRQNADSGATISNITFTWNKLFSCTNEVAVVSLTNDDGTGFSTWFTTLDNNYYVKPNISNVTNNYLITNNKVNGSDIDVDHTLTGWKSFLGLDTNSHGSPLGSPLSSVNDVHLKYNATEVNKTFTLSATMVDVTGTSYSGTITLTPYTSIVLLGAGSITEEDIEIIPVTAITVTGTGNATTISTNHGTLQMSAHCDPHGATDQTVIWSVTNNTGIAVISSTGLVTAVANGTIIVKATANG